MTRRRRDRGGKGGKEPRVRIRQREQDVVRLATEGRTQDDIARAVGVSQAAVSKILRRMDERWIRENVDRIARHKADQDRKLTHLFGEAMRAWEQSKAQHTRRRQRRTDGGDDGASTSVAEVVVDDSHGDPRYLEVVRRTLADRARIWGDERTDLTDPEAPTVFTLRVRDLTPAGRGKTRTRRALRKEDQWPKNDDR